jgi:hypothetical protein
MTGYPSPLLPWPFGKSKDSLHYAATPDKESTCVLFRLSLEPFSAGKAVEYVALAPATPLIASRLRLFLKELSSVYEVLNVINF